jgi:peptidoglycan hydrolase-like protein with peptidoglycan-binding domain
MPAENLGPGSEGADVKALQNLLNRGGWLAEDGIFGPATEDAVKSFQQSKGLVVDGIVGPLTHDALTGKPPSVF